MAQPRFDPSQAVKFDLGRGAVTMDGGGARVLVPGEALAELCAHAGAEALRNFGRKLGTEAGRRAASRLLDGADKASAADVVEHLGGDLALVGLGSLALEHWGRALVFVVSHAPFGAKSADFMAAVLEGALQRAMARDVRLVRLEDADGTLRLLAVNPATAEKVTGWLSSGVSWGDALTRLNAGGDS